MTEKEKINNILIDVKSELHRANKKFRLFHSAHEGLGVLFEEFQELTDEIKKRPDRTDYELIKQEAIQVAAMAVKLVLSINSDSFC